MVTHADILKQGGPWVRAEVIGGQLLLQGDCLEVMPHMGKVDAVVTDPPYGIDYGRQIEKTQERFGWRKYPKQEWDVAPPPAAFFALVRDISSDAIIWGGNYFTDHLPPSMRWLVWDKGQRDFSLADFEMAWTSQNKAARMIDYPRAAALKDGKQHPTQKPLAVMEWCLGFLPDAKTILDPYMGSGTTLVACQRMGRMGIGIELDPHYFDIACRRVDEATRQPDMFVAPVARPVQQGLDL